MTVVFGWLQSKIGDFAGWMFHKWADKTLVKENERLQGRIVELRNIEEMKKGLERTPEGTWHSPTTDQHFCSVCMERLEKQMPVIHAGGSSTAGRSANFKDCGGYYPNLFPQYHQTTEPEERGILDFDSRYDS